MVYDAVVAYSQCISAKSLAVYEVVQLQGGRAEAPYGFKCSGTRAQVTGHSEEEIKLTNIL